MHSKIITFIASILLPISVMANTALYEYHKGNYTKAVLGFKTLTQTKYPETLFYAGLLSIHGYGKPLDFPFGLKLISRAANKNHLPAQLFMGKYYLDKKEDPAKALHWFKKAAEHGHSAAQLFSAAAYLHGYGTKRNPNKAKRYMIQAAKNGNPVAQYALAKLFLASKHRTNKKLGVIWLIKSAGKNNSQAQYELGKLFYTGRQVAKDKSKGLKWLERAAANQNAAAIYFLAQHEKNVADPANPQKILPLKQGPIKTSPKEKVMQWLVNGNFPKAHLNYKLNGILAGWNNVRVYTQGSFNLSPKLVPIQRQQIFQRNFSLASPTKINLTEFIKVMGPLNYQQKQAQLSIPRYPVPFKRYYSALFKKALNRAQLGYAEAQFKLGQFYEYGLGAKPDMQKAILWYRKAAAQYYLKAEYKLGLLYLEGDGVKKNYRSALFWLNKAAFRGNAYAQYVLGVIHEYGLGKKNSKNYIGKNLQLTMGMYNLAASNAYPDAQFHLADLYSSGIFAEKKTLTAQRKRSQLILALYENAAKQGLNSAELALAYYYAAYSKNNKKLYWAFQVAQDQAQQNNKSAAFLLGVMYDRGLGTDSDKITAVYWYHKVVGHNPLTQFILGTYYYLGAGVEKSNTKSIQLLSKAADYPVPYANYNLAILMYQHNLKADFLRLLKKAAQQNYTQARLALADYYLLHANKAQQFKQAAAIYQKLAAIGYPKAQLKLAYIYEHGLSGKPNFHLAQKWYQKAASQNNPLAQYLLANMYQVGKIKKTTSNANLAKAKFWYEKAAKLGFVPAEVALGFLYETVDHNYAQARAWYQKAALNNNPQGQFNLALMYDYGKGMRSDARQAYQWYTKAATQGYAPAQYALAHLYLYALNDPRQARDWYLKAAAQNYPHAFYQLGLINEAGVGISIDLADALAYYQKAAHKGHVKAQVALARLYDFGIEVTADKTTAFDYYQRAAQQNHIFAQKQLAYRYQYGIGTKQDLARAKSLYAKAALDNVNTGLINPTKAKGPAPSPSLLYMQALDAFSGGNLQASTRLLSELMQQHPRFLPAKRIYELLETESGVEN